jgi:hypothetical protein
MAQSADPEFGNAIKILDSIVIPGLQALVAVVVAYSCDSTFQTAPKL